MRVTHDERNLRLLVRQMRWEAEGVVSVELCDPTGALPAWAPGSHLDLHLPGQVVRQYSLCGSPGATSWTIAVLREPASRGGSRAVHELVRPGQEIDVVGPRNNFELLPAPAYLFIAGGIGITPLKPMLAAAEKEGADWRLLYGGRSRTSMAFLDEICEQYGDRVTVHPHDEYGLLDLAAAVGQTAHDALIYACGPEPLLKAIEEHTRAANWPTGALKLERFAPKESADATGAGEQDFEVELSSSGTCIKVLAGQSILDALEAHGYSAPNSCREGICGTCETAVLAGVPDHRDSLLSEEEQAANDTMMICVGRSRSDRLVLDL